MKSTKLHKACRKIAGAVNPSHPLGRALRKHWLGFYSYEVRNF